MGSREREHVTTEQLQQELARTASTLPVVGKIARLFPNKKMFDSYDAFADEGFKLVDHAGHKIMAGTHKAMPGYMVKKYNDDKPGEKQLVNYMRRVEGSHLIRAFIANNGFTRVVAPAKWLYELPPSFPERYLVIAERLDLASERDTLRNYDRISKEQVRELATILYYFRGLNSTAANLPYTEDGRIAFIDTERWSNNKDYLSKVGDRLPNDRRRLAEEIYEQLDRQRARPFESAFR